MVISNFTKKASLGILFLTFLYSCNNNTDFSQTRDSSLSNPTEIIIEDDNNDIFDVYDELAKEKPTTFFKEWQFDAVSNTITVDKNTNKEAALAMYNHKLWLGFDDHVAKENTKTMKYLSTSPFSNMKESGTFSTPLLINGEPFSGVLIGIHEASGKRILEIQYYEGRRIGTFNVWTNLGRLYTKSFKEKIQLMDIEAVRKPVVYLYPEKEQDINIKVDFKGEITHSYPKYNTAKGWDISATPQGLLTDKQSGKEYPYLFWEGKSPFIYSLDKGFVVEGENTVAFLEDKLAYMGLNRREIADFITYWMPHLENNAYNLIHFSTDEYLENAPMEISPAPETIIRIFMVYKPLESPIHIPEQTLTKAERTGFTVVEWGGKKAQNVLN